MAVMIGSTLTLLMKEHQLPLVQLTLFVTQISREIKHSVMKLEHYIIMEMIIKVVWGTETPTSTVLDVIGEIGEDPGAGWSVAGVADATKDHTLVRKCGIFEGNTDWAAVCWN